METLYLAQLADNPIRRARPGRIFFEDEMPPQRRLTAKAQRLRTSRIFEEAFRVPTLILAKSTYLFQVFASGRRLATHVARSRRRHIVLLPSQMRLQNQSTREHSNFSH